MSATQPTVKHAIHQGMLLLLDIRARGPRVVRKPPTGKLPMIDMRIARRSYKVPAGTRSERN